MKFITTLLLFVSLSVFAQTKTGTIDVDYIATQMPEYTVVQTTIDTYAQSLDTDYQIKLTEFNTAMDSYKLEEGGLTILQKKEKQDAILILEDGINKFRNNSSKLIDIKRDELFRPLYKKIGAALQIVAEAQGYTLIMQTNESMVYIDATTDVTRSVITQLGIEIKE
ncbi:MAG: outer membrane protein [Saprospiraceae bacterium]|jgi:outer membrane protein|uniref:OmpH family outer membrane protein n=1 Tax=Patiriisocius sp. Uisw_047 TaxID=3230969 RepID=UPI0039ED5651